VPAKSDDEGVLKLESVNYELRVALRECRDQLERVEKFLELSEQDGQPDH
jgi:hypothetical protein